MITGSYRIQNIHTGIALHRESTRHSKKQYWRAGSAQQAAKLSGIEFKKYQGLGNDFVLVSLLLVQNSYILTALS